MLTSLHTTVFDKMDMENMEDAAYSYCIVVNTRLVIITSYDVILSSFFYINLVYLVFTKFSRTDCDMF